MSDRVWPTAPRSELAATVSGPLAEVRGAGVVVSGEPGIGKTTLLQQVLDGAGGPALALRGSTLAAEVPFGALHPHLAHLPDADLVSSLAVTRAVSRALRGRSDGARPVVVVDNSPLVDEHTAHVLAGLAESGAAALAVTAVDVVDMPQPFVELWRDGLLPSVAVPPLTDDEIGGLLTGYLGGPVAAATLRHLTAGSEGNPLMLRYLVEDAVGAEALAPHDGVWSMTAGASAPGARLAQLVGTRLGRWSAAERDGLEIVALTERIPLDVLARLVDPAALERLERSGAVVVDGEPEPTARIAGRLVADVVRRGVPFTRRRALREQVLAAGADLTSGPPARLLAYALWTLESGAELEPGLAVRAARAADHLFDPELALRLATPVLEGGHHGAAAVVRVRALRRMGLAGHAAQVAAAELEGPLDDRDRAALVAEQAAALVRVEGGVQRGLASIATTREVLDARSARTLDVPELLLRYVDGATEELVGPLRGAPPEGQDGLLSSALLAAVLASTGRQHEALRPLEQATAALVAPGIDPEVRFTALLVAAATAVDCGRWSEAHALLQRGLAGAGPEALVLGGAVETAQGLLHALAGRTAEARTALLSALSQARRRDPFLTSGPALAGLALCAARTGDDVAARSYVAEHGEARPAPRPLSGAARLCLLTARALLGDDVEAELLGAADDDLGSGRRMDAVHVLAAALRSGSTEAVERLRALTLPEPGPLAAAVFDHAAGLQGDDAGLLLRAAEAYAAIGDAAAAADAAGAAQARPGVDRETTRAAQRVLVAARREMGVVRPRGARETTREGLTPREQEVASRAAARLTNQDIARELHLSVRTVESYLQSAFAKLGIGSRTELRDVLVTAS